MGDELKELGDSIAELQRLLGETSANNPIEAEEVKKNKKETFVRVTEDKHEGWLYLAKPQEGQTYSKEEILLLLRKNGIRTGYIMSNIIAMVKKGVYERSIKVALYKEAVEGKNGYYEFAIDTNLINTKTPRIREDGTVDYNSVNYFIGVKEGQLLCTYHPAVQGEKGYLVDGTELVPLSVGELPQMKGKGIKFEKETNQYFSEFDGRLDFKDTYEMQVNKVLSINGDVNQLNQKIEFNGDVEINGNIESGVVIRCTHSVSVSGVVEAAEIRAGGDIILKRGIQGSNKAKIIANGNVYADFIEHSEVRAQGEVKANSILNSEVYSDSTVTLTGKRGTVIGGYTHARKGISCVNAGNTSEVKTVVHVGLETKDYLKNQDVLKKDAYLRDQLKEVLEKLNSILAQKKKNPNSSQPGELVELNLLKVKKDELMQELQDNQRDEDVISKVVEEARNAEIRVEGHLYRGVIISVDASRLPIQNSTQYMIYKGNNGVIEGSVIVVN